MKVGAESHAGSMEEIPPLLRQLEARNFQGGPYMRGVIGIPSPE